MKTRVLIVGGGIVGCSVAYHLAKMGWTDVTVVEKGELTSGSTWHAAGLVGQLRSSRNITRMLQYSVELYKNLEAETGQATGWKESGGLRLASSTDRMQELKRSATVAKSFGLEMHLLSPKEAQELFPIMTLDGVVGAAFLPTDGYADPSGITHALAKGARNRGVTIRRNERVLSIDVEARRVVRVHTDQTTIEPEIIVNAAGMWARELGAMAGVFVPVVPVQHQYLVTEKSDQIPTGLPTMRDPDNLVYYKEEVGALVMGGYELDPIPWALERVPPDFGQELLPPDFDHFESLLTKAFHRTPILEELGARQLINGPEGFTPDGHFVMGQAPELDNFFVAAGFNAHGIAAGGGAGKMLAEWIVEGEPAYDLWPVDIRRFGPHYRQSWRYTRERTLEAYARHYAMGWPHMDSEVARNLRRSPLEDRLRDLGAVFGQKFGWERADYYLAPGEEAGDPHTFAQPPWFAQVARECQTVRERVALIDQSPFSKIEVSGPGALMFLQGLAANNVRKPVGRLTYTQLCNEKGGIECDLTIARVADETFYLVTGTAFGTHDMDWIQRHAPRDGSVQIRDVTEQWAVLNLCGPAARDVLAQVSPDDVSHEAFPFAHCRTIEIGYAPVRALRVTYVGELGWELHIPAAYALHVFEQLWEAGQAHGIGMAGYHAIDALRLEKGYRYWSKDITPGENPYEAGLGFAVSHKKRVDFVGKQALAKIREQGPTQTLCCFTIDAAVELHGSATILQGDAVQGVVTSWGYGHTIGKTIAYGYLPVESANAETYLIEAYGERYTATRHDEALYDPERNKIMR